jgi:HAD superfamily hydrolase (TIGR01484 family)
MGRPDLLVVDLDGTLLGADGRVSAENAAALDRAKAAGLPCIIATGRTLSECRQVLESIDYGDPLIAASGSLLVETSEQRTVDRREIESSLVSSIVELVADTLGVVMLLKDRSRTSVDYVLVGQRELHPVSTWWFKTTGATFHRVDHIADDPFPDDTVRIGAVGTAAEFEPMVDRLEAALGNRILARHWEAVTSSAHAGQCIHLLEVFHPEADKWTMLQSYCRTVGLDTNRAAAVGDGLNDVLLIQECGLGVAVKNADARVLAVADAVTDAHHQHGVAMLIDDLLEGRLRLGGTRT